MAGGAFSLNMLQEVISTISVQNKARVIMVADACRSGKLSGSTVGGAQITGSNLARQYANEIKILSCQPDEYSIEGEQWGGGRGAFSYHLLDGLYGMADGNGDQSVNLLEIGRYLEDHVSTEVAPQSQIPMTVGGKGETLTVVYPEVLDQLKEGRKGQMQLFAATESRGMEEDVLAAADTNVVKMYTAFKQSILDKNFLEPQNACADYYYEKLSHEPQLERLHSSMLRNYAAALQDDAQQVLNNWLIDDPDEYNLSRVSRKAKYKRYPEYIERAAELLTREHYMYPALQARKLYFEGYLMHVENRNKDQHLGMQILEKYQASLKWQPGSPHVYRSMGRVYFFQYSQADSAQYYMAKATEAAPSWVSPYSNLANMYLKLTGLHNIERAHYFLGMADQVDSTASMTNIWHIVSRANYYLMAEEYENAEEEYLKAIQLDSTICAPICNLGIIYFRQGKLEEAIFQFMKGLELDSTLVGPNTNLANIYFKKRQYSKAELHFERVVELDSSSMQGLSGLARIYIITNRVAEGEALFKKALALDSTSIIAYMTMGSSYAMIRDFDKAEQAILKLLKIDSTFASGIVFLGNIYYMQGRQLEASQEFDNLLRVALDRMENDRLDEARIALEMSNKMMLFQKYKRSLCEAVLYGERNETEKAFELLEDALEGGYQLDDPFLDVKTYQGFDPLRAYPKRWNELINKYSPDTSGDKE
jgi:tetratricopeptide (TPR) repeat protein